jgi:methoxymalonate biosynthesis acyl carrier protein
MSDPHVDIRQFILSRFPGVAFADSEDIFRLGVATSLFAMELVMFVEKHFDLQIPNEELELANFRSVDAMAVLVERRLAAV